MRTKCANAERSRAGYFQVVERLDCCDILVCLAVELVDICARNSKKHGSWELCGRHTLHCDTVKQVERAAASICLSYTVRNRIHARNPEEVVARMVRYSPWNLRSKFNLQQKYQASVVQRNKETY